MKRPSATILASGLCLSLSALALAMPKFELPEDRAGVRESS